MFVGIHLSTVFCRAANAQRSWLQVETDRIGVKTLAALKLVLLTDLRCLTFPFSSEFCHPLMPKSLSLKVWAERHKTAEIKPSGFQIVHKYYLQIELCVLLKQMVILFFDSQHSEDILKTEICFK